MVLCLLVGNLAHAEKKFKVITTFTIIQDMAKNIAGEAAIVESITKPGAEIHGYQPTPGDIVKAQSADLILWNGLHLESWFERFFDNIKKKVPKAVVTEGITPLPIREALYKGAANPHAWMSPSNALIYIDNILRALVKHDPIHAKIYQHNAKIYAAKITALDGSLRERLARIPADQRYLVTSEGAFSYLAKDYDLKELYLWPINAEEQGSARQMQAVIDQVRQHKIPVVFSESTISDKSAKQISKETGARYGGVLYVDSLSDAQGPVPTYIDLLNVTVDTIAKGFNQ
nr:metal ABC transporter substrate-binding protein [Candidatus Regiella insecticola]